MSEPEPKDEFAALYARYRTLGEGVRAEIVAGEIRMVPAPRPRHVRTASVLGIRLGGKFGFDSDDGPGGWVILDEPELRFGDEIRIPDLAGWRVERYREPEDNPIELVPDWICEILSPSTARSDRKEKMPLYATAGVGHLWIIDPALHTLEVYRREGELWVVAGNYEGEDQVSAEPFTEAALDLGALWRIPGA
ncbi:MAG: Uma2 family endonuclease [Deltaproteobacteria bacterium]|nr:Uma2 family endonuclease [Deltaproteobacteria bacterium]